MQFIRQPAVAGMFYPADKEQLQTTVRGYLEQVPQVAAAPKALIVPHAGYDYSGPVAASGFARLRQARGILNRVVLLGPSHHLAFRGCATCSAHWFATPLGDIPIDRHACDALRALPFVHLSDEAHAQEHCLEVHLPFLQEVLGDFSLVPIVVGDATPDEVAALLDLLWGGDETLVVVSSDLSHYHDDATARRIDAATSKAIEQLRPEQIRVEGACGRLPISGLLLAAKHRGLSARTIDLRNSGDTAGPKNRVVGYGAYVFQ